MDSTDTNIREAIAAKASEWLVAHNDGPLNAEDSAALATWLKSSPAHIEEFLALSAVARDLKQARTHPEFSLAAVLQRARAETDPTIVPFHERLLNAVRIASTPAWRRPFVIAAASCAVLLAGLLVS